MKQQINQEIDPPRASAQATSLSVRTKYHRFPACITLTLTVALASHTTFAFNSTWTGSGVSGVDSLGQAWEFVETGWGIPGLEKGTIPWIGPDFITGFSITFDGLPVTTEIIASDPPSEATAFEVDSQAWDRVIDGKSVTFSAPDLVLNRLNPNQEFFVNVSFEGEFDPANVSFVAEYSMIVPEPCGGALTLVTIALQLLRRKPIRGRRSSSGFP